MSSGRRTEFLFFATGLVFLAFGLLCTPENLLKLEIMENAIESPSELVRKGARLEIEGARAVAFTTAAVLFGLLPFWPRIEASARYRAFMDRRRVSLREHRLFRRRIRTPSFAVMMAAIALVFLYIALADKLLTPEQMLRVQMEDGIIEGTSALFLLCASVLSVRIALRLGRGRPEFYMHLFLGLLFFVMCGEEISWGQRYLGLQTPEFISAVNVQGEINFHNVYGYLFDHIFILGFLTWGVAVPLLDRFAPFFRQLFAAIGLPVPSAGLAVAMLVISMIQSVIVYKFIDPFTDPSLPVLRLPEPRELLSALAFFVLMMEVWVLVGLQAPADRQRAASEDGLGTPDSPRRS